MSGLSRAFVRRVGLRRDITNNLIAKHYARQHGGANWAGRILRIATSQFFPGKVRVLIHGKDLLSGKTVSVLGCLLRHGEFLLYRKQPSGGSHISGRTDMASVRCSLG